ncbi:hypothetical protein [Halorubrum tebenquichense]|uniref:Uncharacterized protein n=1 Tax=Halorubrum tebenquichense DSM 14210 TaxID=1227485 RepID=M0DYS6_9EURY|nr:hypothetical protein [Halorubrum tebenquichense]ELZ40695.1 hypothetical protein C472_01484 [Halorubrum tebenquichense DSM 14210]
MNFDRIRDDAETTAYTAGVERVDPEEYPSLASAGYHSETTLYVVMAGGEVYSSHDRYAIARELPGDASWVTGALRELEREQLGVPT